MSRVPLQDRQNELKRLAFRLLDDLEENGVRCLGMYGTALGAARHGNMIPWDDDIDFGILREDFPKAMDVLRRDADLYVWNWDDDPTDPTPLPKVFWKIAKGDGGARKDAHVDIFVLEAQPAWKWRRFLLAGLLMWIRLLVMAKLPSEAARKGARKRYALFRWAARVAAWPFPVAFLKRWFGRLVKARRRTTGELWVPSDSPMFNVMATFRRADCEHPVRLPFGERDIPVPAHIEDHLKEAYGDWRSLPPPEQRKPHSWTDDGTPLVLLPRDELRMKT